MAMNLQNNNILLSKSYYIIVLREIDNLTGLLACEKQTKQKASKCLHTLNIMEDSHIVDSL